MVGRSGGRGGRARSQGERELEGCFRHPCYVNERLMGRVRLSLSPSSVGFPFRSRNSRPRVRTSPTMILLLFFSLHFSSFPLSFFPFFHSLSLSLFHFHFLPLIIIIFLSLAVRRNPNESRYGNSGMLLFGVPFKCTLKEKSNGHLIDCV